MTLLYEEEYEKYKGQEQQLARQISKASDLENQLQKRFPGLETDIQKLRREVADFKKKEIQWDADRVELEQNVKDRHQSIDTAKESLRSQGSSHIHEKRVLETEKNRV